MPPSPTRDYGVTAQAGISRPAKIAFVTGVALAIVGAAFVVGRSWWEARSKAIANADAWTISGPPCPELTQAQFEASGLKTRKSTEYNGLTFRRVAGHLACNEVVNSGGKGIGKYAVCQFTAPSVLTVTAGDRSFYYHPGIGQDTTVEVRGDSARCVMGATSNPMAS
jgi:hypothetical protein